MKLAKIPRHVPAATVVMRSQKLSCASGQWYFRRRWTVTISVVGMVVAGEGHKEDQMRRLPPDWSVELRRQSCRWEEAFSSRASEAARDQERHLGRNSVDAEPPIATALMILSSNSYVSIP